MYFVFSNRLMLHCVVHFSIHLLCFKKNAMLSTKIISKFGILQICLILLLFILFLFLFLFLFYFFFSSLCSFEFIYCVSKTIFISSTNITLNNLSTDDAMDKCIVFEKYIDVV